MGLSSTVNRIVYTGNGSSASFNFPYYFFAQTDLVVYTFDTVLNSSYLQVLNTSYTISGVQNAQGLYTSGANIILGSSPNATTDVVIFRNPPRVQNYALLQNGNISSAALIQEMDYLTALIQRMDDKATRSLRLPDGFGGTFSTDLPTNIPLYPNAALVVNSGGNGITIGSTPIFAGAQGYVLTGNGGSTAATFQQISLTGSSVTGTLSLSNGGTGGITPQEWGVVFASSATQLATTNPGPSGLPLISVASNAPIFSQLNLASAATGLLPLPNITPGINGQVLTTGSAGVLSWQVASAAASGAALIGNNLSDMSSTSTAFKNISPMTTTGDVIIYGSNALQVRLAAGAVNQVLTGGGVATQPFWQTNISGSGALQISAYISGSGALQIGNNLSDLANKPQALQNISPTTTWGDIFYAGSGNIQTRLAAGTSTQVLSTGGAGAAPSWVTVATGSSLSNPMTALGDMIYAGSGNVVTKLTGSISSSTAFLAQVGTGSISAAPSWRNLSPVQVTVITASSGTYTLPSNPSPLYLRVRMVGGGGGGGGGGSAPGTGTSGSSSIFGFLVAAGGGPGGSAGPGGATPTLGDFNVPGQNGGIGCLGSATASVGGNGGGSLLGLGGQNAGVNAGGAQGAGPGAGGGGGGDNLTTGQSFGGGGGAYTEKFISGSALTSTFSFVTGSPGSGGNAGTSGQAGAAGLAGVIIVEAHFQ